ncbi:gcvP [Symbiodinium sp. CCMP2456]|nr:gcvP [Symbiodinium sp. CCMP2456]
MDLEEFKALCAEYKDRLACLMVTYPSTRAFFEDNIQEICSTVHENGGQVYMDGANMNAQLGLTSPGMIGADVCHLNLHKTFSIPHGGGGPGLGPICAKKHLAPHLPGHCVVNPPTAGSDPAGAVSAAPWGQAGIACIPWMFCTMLGKQGVLDSGRYSILNANYMKARLEPHFDIAPTNKNNRCAHEFIMDFSDIRKKSGIVEEDIAKRLQEGKKAAHSKASIFYGADEYLEELKKKYEHDRQACVVFYHFQYEHDHEIAALKNALPGEGDPNAAGVAQSSDKMLSVQKNNENRSLKTNRLFPTPNKPDPMPQNLAFLFTKITPDWDIKEQMIYMWNVLTAIFFTQVLMVIGYCAALACFPDFWWTCTLCFGIPFSYIAIQNIYIDHDVMHGATFPVYEWQRFLTHPFADFFSLPWEEFVLEHNRHHASTVDLLIQGEFGWDPEEFHYALQQWAGPWSSNWYKYLLTVPFIPMIHFFGLNDTGSLFALEWWMHFPDEGAGGKCNKEFWSKWIPRRVKHNAFVLSLWACVWLLGTYPLGRPLSEGWRFMFTVSVFARIGYSAAWMFITNFTHSLPWNEFLAQDPGRTWPVLHNVMAMVLGGKHRWNEMLFHDVHHAFPNAVGTLSQRGRFHGWEKVHDAAAEVLHRGLWKPNGDEETQMQKTQKKRSLMMKQGK